MLPTINTHTGHHPDISTHTADAVPHERRTIQIHRRTRFSSSSALSFFFASNCDSSTVFPTMSLTVSFVLSLCLTHCACVLLSHSLTLCNYFILHPFFSLCVTVLGSHTCYVTPAHLSAQLHTR